MPTYSYACTACENAFDIVQSFSDDSLTVCPECNGKLRKIFNSVGIVFKGSGFYRNDSRSTSTSTETAGNSSTSSAASTNATSASTKTESTPAAAPKTENKPKPKTAAVSS